MVPGSTDPKSTNNDSKSEPASGPTAPVDPAKGNELLKRLFSSRPPIVHEPAPAPKE